MVKGLSSDEWNSGLSSIDMVIERGYDLDTIVLVSVVYIMASNCNDDSFGSSGTTTGIG